MNISSFLLAFAPAGDGEGGGNPLPLLLMMGAMVALFWFMIIRPQRKRKKEDEKMRTELAVGDEILTIGGIYGRVVSKKEDNTLIIETGMDRSQIKIAHFAIQRVLTVKD